MIGNFKEAEKIIETAATSSGSALAENEKSLDSIVGKTAKFQATFETMATTFVDNDLIKGVVDAGTMLLEAGTWIGDNLGGALALFTGGRIVDTITGFKDGIDGFKEGIGSLVKDTKLEKLFQIFGDGKKNAAGGGKLTPLFKYARHIVMVTLNELATPVRRYEENGLRRKPL